MTLNSVQSPINLLGMSRHELVSWCQSEGHKPYRANQLLRWIHQFGLSDFSQMTDLAKEFRYWLCEHAVVEHPPIIRDHVSHDGTRKWLLSVDAANSIETVFIPEKRRGTLCVSSQAGCNVGCPFCSTGAQGFNRNLRAEEIVGQIWMAEFLLRQPSAIPRVVEEVEVDVDEEDVGHLNDQPEQPKSKRVISNVVFMGMGEPLLNFDAVVKSINLMLEDHAYGLSRRRVTVSTSGVVPKIRDLARTQPVALAVSLHAPNDNIRDVLVPLNQKYPIMRLLEACEDYLQFAPRDVITFEYCMLDGVNDQIKHAKELIEIIKKIPCKINLIPFNPFPRSGYRCSPPAVVKAFSDCLQQAGLVTTIRKTRGQDIDAACGQLAGNVYNRLRIIQ